MAARASYRYQLVTLPPPDDVVCPICLDIVAEPHQLTCCGQHLCKGCGQDLTGSPCPLCRNKSHHIVPDRYFERNILNHLRVRCETCEKVCELGTMARHLEACSSCSPESFGCSLKEKDCLIEKLIKMLEEKDRQMKEKDEKLKLLERKLDMVLKSTNQTRVMKGFSDKRGSYWFSTPYYLYDGYKMCFEVDMSGKHLRIDHYLMSGPYDKSLQWPFTGIVYIQITNQLRGTDHWYYLYDYTNAVNEGRRVVTKSDTAEDVQVADDSGRGKFYKTNSRWLSLSKLANDGYLVDDTLQFVVLQVVQVT